MNDEVKADNVTDIDVDNVADEQALDLLRQQEQEPEKTEPEAPKEEVKAEVKEEPKEEKTKFVPYDALHEERMKRKELKERLEKQEQRFQEFMQKLAPKEEKPVFENEVDAIRYQHEQIAKNVQEQQRYIEEQRKAAEHQARIHGLVHVYKSKAEEFSKKTPDFNNAYKFLLDSRKAEYAAAGYSPEYIDRFLQEDELGIVNKALEDEADPAERVYKIALARGYKPEKKQPDKLENIEKGMKASKTLQNMSGSSPKGLTLEAIADLDDDEFAKLSYEDIRRIAAGN